MSGVEDQLRDAMVACRAQLRAPAGMWAAIERDTTDRRAPLTARGRHRPIVTAAVVFAAAAVVSVVVGFGLGRDSTRRVTVATPPVTIEEFTARADRACDDFIAAWPYSPVAFNSAFAYETAADKLAGAVRAWAEQLSAGGVPASVETGLNQALAAVPVAAADTGRVKALAATGDLNAAAATLNQASGVVSQAGDVLAALGALDCEHL